MAELLPAEHRPFFVQKLIDAFVTIDELRAWLRAHYPTALPQLTGANLRNELANLLTWADGEDGRRSLLQQLADHPPGPEIAGLINAYTHGDVQPRTAQSVLPAVSAHLSWFAASRPFVNRSDLREHLARLETSAGAESVLVVDGDARTGKTFTVSLVMQFDAAQNSVPPIDIADFDRVSATLNARDLVVLIAGGDEQGCPPFDETKEDEAVPRLMSWLIGKLKGKRQWIVVDHCRRRVLTDAARTVLRELAGKLRLGVLPNVRLILVDFDRGELPKDWRFTVRHDRAELPDQGKVAEWCKQLAAAAKRKHDPGDPVQWASQVFSGLDGHSQADGSWHIELERQLKEAYGRIMAREVLP